jgi:hypothetical protein
MGLRQIAEVMEMKFNYPIAWSYDDCDTECSVDRYVTAFLTSSPHAFHLLLYFDLHMRLIQQSCSLHLEESQVSMRCVMVFSTGGLDGCIVDFVNSCFCLQMFGKTVASSLEKMLLECSVC